jgi:isocitrate dehydrogenase
MSVPGLKGLVAMAIQYAIEKNRESVTLVRHIMSSPRVRSRLG